MSSKGIKSHGISLTPLRPAILTFTVDEDGLEYVRQMIDVMQRRYGMRYEEAVEQLNASLGGSEGRPAAVIVWGHPEGVYWFHETPEHYVRQRFEGMYWARDKLARDKVAEWMTGKGEGKAVHEYLNWTAEQYAKWVEDGTLPPATNGPWVL